MLDLGLMRGEIGELIEKEAYKRFYMHGTSHWLGLDVHDAGSYAKGKEPRKLEPGMVFTVEPGLYSATHGGVRIEDMAVVTASGHEILAALPEGLDWSG